jgi:sugar phosphate isomerase/epimerase
MAAQTPISRRGFLKTGLGVSAAGLLSAGLSAGSEAAARSAAPGGWQVGIYTRPWEKYDYRVALDAIAEAGFKHAGLMTTATEDRRLVIDADLPLEQAQAVGREVKSRGMEISSVYGGNIPVDKSLEAGIQGLRRLIDNCVAAGARSLLMGGTGNEKLFDVYYKAIAECCDYAAEKNLPITVKPHGGLNATGSQCRKCIEGVGHKNFSLWYDPGNVFFYSNGELDPVDDAATVGGLVKVGMCIKDFVMRDVDGKPTRDVWVTPGTGRVDFPAVMRALAQGGFTGGSLVIECVDRGDGQLPGLLEEAKKARRFVEKLTQA